MYSTATSVDECLSSGRTSFSYFLASKAAFAEPTLTHQFRVEWPWPTARAAAEVKKEASAASTPTAGHSPPSTPAAAAAAARSGAHTTKDTAGRRFGRPTSILSLSSDPHPPRTAQGVPVVDLAGTQRVAMLLSPGPRLHLPLLPADGEGAEGQGDGVTNEQSRPAQHWRSVYKQSKDFPAGRNVPNCTELVIGELASVEWIMRAWRARYAAGGGGNFTPATHAASAPPYSRLVDASSPPAAKRRATEAAVAAAPVAGNAAADADASGGGDAGDCLLPFWARAAPGPPMLPVHAYLMGSVPHRVLWLSALSDRLLVSLPCEERVVTLWAPQPASVTRAGGGDRDGGGDGGGGGAGAPVDPCGFSSGRVEPVHLRPTHVFSLPRGVVPLDVVEILHRPFVAIGTYEHGVLVCWLDTDTGAVTHTALSVSLNGLGSAIFPVTRLAAVFPPVLAWPWAQCWPQLAGVTGGRGRAAQVQFLSSLNDGAFICSSPFDQQAAVLKSLAAGAASVAEGFAPGRPAEQIQSVGSLIDHDTGVMVATAQGNLLRFQCFPEGTTAGGGASNNGNTNDNAEAGEEDDSDDSDDMTFAARAVAAPDLGRAMATRHLRATYGLVSERLSPILLRSSSVSRQLRVHRIGDTAPVFELKPTKRDPLDGAMVQHLLPVSTYDNEIVLLTRILTVYKPLSAVRLAPMLVAGAEAAAGEQPPMGYQPLGRSRRGAKKAKKAKKETAPAKVHAGGVIHVEDLCTGVVVLSAGHQWLTVAAAHNGDTVSVLTYQGIESEVGRLKRFYVR